MGFKEGDRVIVKSGWALSLTPQPVTGIIIEANSARIIIRTDKIYTEKESDYTFGKTLYLHREDVRLYDLKLLNKMDD